MNPNFITRVKQALILGILLVFSFMGGVLVNMSVNHGKFGNPKNLLAGFISWGLVGETSEGSTDTDMVISVDIETPSDFDVEPVFQEVKEKEQSIPSYRVDSQGALWVVDFDRFFVEHPDYKVDKSLYNYFNQIIQKDRPSLSDPLRKKIATYLIIGAREANIDPLLFCSVVQRESHFNPAARSRAGAIGLGQLMPMTARELGVDPTQIEDNLRGSARYLRKLLDRFRDQTKAIAAYNAGPTIVAKKGPNVYRETRNYVQRVSVSYKERVKEWSEIDSLSR